jgi:hypothetical protein
MQDEHKSTDEPDQLLEMTKKYKHGESVYVYVPPGHSTNPEDSPLWEGIIHYVEATRKLSVYDDEVKEEIEITLNIGCGFDNITRSSKDVFTDFEDAKAYALEQMQAIDEKRIAYKNKLILAKKELLEQVAN